MLHANDLLARLNGMDEADLNQVISVCGASGYVGSSGSKRAKVAELVTWMGDHADRAGRVEEAIHVVGADSPRSATPLPPVGPAVQSSRGLRRVQPGETPVRSGAEQLSPAHGASSSPAGTPEALRVFVCYSRRNEETVKELCTWLRAEGAEPWLDQDSMHPGDAWEDEIRQAVKAADIFLVCLSSQVVGRRAYVHKEIRFALDEALSVPEGQIYIVPLKLDPCDLPSSLARWQAVDYFADYEKALSGLRKTLTKVRQQKGG